jgi:quercetin dioxygenase-like cupin family protein
MIPVPKRHVIALAAAAALALGGVALAGHITIVDPSTVPTGMLAAHNSIDDVPVSALARAVKPDGADLFVQHVRLGPNVATGWHTHPGPALVAVVDGSLTYEDAKANRCNRIVYGEGFVDRGFGHVHRAVAGAEGADFYVAYILPPDSATHVIAASGPAECSS